MEPIVSPIGFCLSLFVLMVAAIEIGRRIYDRRRSRAADEDKSGLTTVEGAVFALFGLMIAFTFSGAASRLNEKRELIVEEANSIETAYMQIDLLPDDARPSMRDLLRDYTDSRIETYRKLPDMAAGDQEMVHTKEIAETIWTRAVAESQRGGAHADAGRLLLPALNSMFDMMSTRTMALHLHPPRVIYFLLYGLGVLCALLAGYRMAGTRHRSWVHILVFVTITVSVVYVTLDLEYPRWGLIRLAGADEFIVNVRKDMH